MQRNKHEALLYWPFLCFDNYTACLFNLANKIRNKTLSLCLQTAAKLPLVTFGITQPLVLGHRGLLLLGSYWNCFFDLTFLKIGFKFTQWRLHLGAVVIWSVGDWAEKQRSAGRTHSEHCCCALEQGTNLLPDAQVRALRWAGDSSRGVPWTLDPVPSLWFYKGEKNGQEEQKNVGSLFFSFQIGWWQWNSHIMWLEIVIENFFFTFWG